MPNYRIPRQSDREIIAALGKVQRNMKPLIALDLRVVIPHSGDIILHEDNPEDNQRLAVVLNAGSEVLHIIALRLPAPNMDQVVSVQRTFDKVSDDAKIDDGWISKIEAGARTQVWISLLANVRKELKATELEAAFRGQEDTAWNRYRDAQAEVVNSLQQTSESLLIKVAERNAQLDAERNDRFRGLEEKLRTELTQNKTTLENQIAEQREILEKREKLLADREASFETKESQYVSRQKQGEQITQIQAWLNGWHLTEGTRKKRSPILYAYISAMVLTGILTTYSIYHSYDLLKTADDLAKLQWWHWVALTLKTFLPLAAFSTFLIYFIRWSGAWARQHAEEEFRNRTRLIDIGRSSWLLEAVRDAQERNKEIPVELLKELSRNLFVNDPDKDTDIHPHAAADILLQGLTSLRVKSPGGAEVEAKRGE